MYNKWDTWQGENSSFSNTSKIPSKILFNIDYTLFIKFNIDWVLVTEIKIKN